MGPLFLPSAAPEFRRQYDGITEKNALNETFVTSSVDDITELQETAGRVGRIISAMNKMLEEMAFDCDECEYVDVCDEVEELGKMRASHESKNQQ